MQPLGTGEQPVQTDDFQTRILNRLAIGTTLLGGDFVDMVGQHERRHLPSGVTELGGQTDGIFQGGFAKRFVAKCKGGVKGVFHEIFGEGGGSLVPRLLPENTLSCRLSPATERGNNK